MKSERPTLRKYLNEHLIKKQEAEDVLHKTHHGSHKAPHSKSTVTGESKDHCEKSAFDKKIS